LRSLGAGTRCAARPNRSHHVPAPRVNQSIHRPRIAERNDDRLSAIGQHHEGHVFGCLREDDRRHRGRGLRRLLRAGTLETDDRHHRTARRQRPSHVVEPHVATLECTPDIGVGLGQGRLRPLPLLLDLVQEGPILARIQLAAPADDQPSQAFRCGHQCRPHRLDSGVVGIDDGATALRHLVERDRASSNQRILNRRRRRTVDGGQSEIEPARSRRHIRHRLPFREVSQRPEQVLTTVAFGIQRSAEGARSVFCSHQSASQCGLHVTDLGMQGTEERHRRIQRSS
jgi:hypothetical protein